MKIYFPTDVCDITIHSGKCFVHFSRIFIGFFFYSVAVDLRRHSRSLREHRLTTHPATAWDLIMQVLLVQGKLQVGRLSLRLDEKCHCKPKLLEFWFCRQE